MKANQLVSMVTCAKYGSCHISLKIELFSSSVSGIIVAAIRPFLLMHIACTTIDGRSRWYKDDPFVLPSQVEQVFYINDTADRCSNGKVVQRFQNRGIWDVLQRDALEANDGKETDVLNQAFQHEETDEVVPIIVQEDPIATTLSRHDIDPEVIQGETVFNSGVEEHARGSSSEDYDDEDESMEESSDKGHLYHTSDSDTDPDY